MAKKSKNPKRKAINKIMKKSEISRKSAVRRSPVPRAVKKSASSPVVTIIQPTEKLISFEMIAERAYHISNSGNGGSQDENWHRAERELLDGI